MDLKIRSAREEEAEILSDLASRSKCHWPYDADYLAKVRSTTHITPEEIGKWPVIVAIHQDRICGFSAVANVRGINMLDHLWVEPHCIGRGIGRILFFESIKTAQALDWKSFQIASDPFAEPFYLKIGAKRIGEWESKIKPGFFLPLLEYQFT